MEVALPNWSVKHLSLWAELVQPSALTLDGAPDVEEVEEVTQEAQFQELRSKLALPDMIQYQLYLCVLSLLEK